MLSATLNTDSIYLSINLIHLFSDQKKLKEKKRKKRNKEWKKERNNERTKDRKKERMNERNKDRMKERKSYLKKLTQLLVWTDLLYLPKLLIVVNS